MRGTFVDQGGLFSYIAPEARVPVNHPLRKIRELVRDVLGELTRSLGRLYASEGRPSIPPEQLLSALLLQVFYGIRSERQFFSRLLGQTVETRLASFFFVRSAKSLYFCTNSLSRSSEAGSDAVSINMRSRSARARQYSERSILGLSRCLTAYRRFLKAL